MLLLCDGLHILTIGEVQFQRGRDTGKIQERYGIEEIKAQKELDTFMASLK
jgi:hypothetical protein